MRNARTFDEVAAGSGISPDRLHATLRSALSEPDPADEPAWVKPG